LTLDSWVVGRLARELRARLEGARIQTFSGRQAGLWLTCYKRGAKLALQLSLDQDGPLLAVSGGGESRNENGAGGWAGGVAPLLRGCTVETVQAVPNDRIIYVDLGSRSAFGVPSRYRLAFELEPLKANALVLRRASTERWQILAAAKQIEGAQGRRSVLVGEHYTPPPPRISRRDRAGFESAASALDPIDVRAIVRLLSDFDPSCSPPLAKEVVARAAAQRTDAPLSALLLDAWGVLRHEAEAALANPNSSVFAWRRGEGFSMCHLVPLRWPPGEPVKFATVNEVCAMQLAGGERRRRAPAAAALRKRLATLLSRCDVEVASLRSAQRAAEDAQSLRVAGDAIYSYISAIPKRASEFVTPEGLRVELDPSLSAKENAALYFKRFKKARSGLPRIAHRLGVLENSRAYWEQLVWELDRAESAGDDEVVAACDEIGEAIGGIKSRARVRAARGLSGRVVSIAGGAVAHVGRSPKDNERVTLAVARPTDLWFHARGVPGAHIVLKMSDPRTEASDEQILTAAALAAGQSRAADAAKVEVDFTQRKHVRKQAKGRPGLVWYTDFKTVLVVPRKL
jgi:predicted ribosome quality control (RQC) complex YloA/Tae2 family protein